MGRLFLAPQGVDSTMTITVGGTTGIPLSLAAQLGYAGTNARCVFQATPSITILVKTFQKNLFSTNISKTK